MAQVKTLAIVATFLLGIGPALLSLWLTELIKRRSLRQLQRAGQMRHQLPPSLAQDSYYLSGVGYLIGDVTCVFNARSPHLRCAVNPDGPCRSCRHYQAKPGLQDLP